MAKRGAAVLEMPEPEYVSASRPPGRGSARVRRGPVEDFADEYEAGANFGPERRQRAVARPAVRLRVGSRLPLPTTMIGLVATGLTMVVLLGSVFWLLAVTRVFLLNDGRFRVAGPGSIEIAGNRYLRRGQLLGIFSDDVERNIFGVSLEQRQAELEAMPWVERATVMRLLPGRLRVAVVERTPVAFVRQGGAAGAVGSIGLVDKDGVLLDLPAGPGAERFQFPVVTGIAAADPASVRAARMHLFARFTAELDAGGAKNTESLSEVDLSNPEDVRALVEEKGATVLVHFGEENFRERFDRMKGLLPQWRAQYPNLASADMRYEHEIPLGMAKVGPVAPLKPVGVPVKAAAIKPVVHPVVAAAKLPAKSSVEVPVKLPPVKTRSFVPGPVVKLWQPVTTAPAGGQTSVSAAARSTYSAKPFAAKPPVLTAPAPLIVKAPVKVPVKAAPQAVAAPAPKIAPTALKKPMGGKPSAGKPVLTNDTNPSPTGAQQ